MVLILGSRSSAALFLTVMPAGVAKNVLVRVQTLREIDGLVRIDFRESHSALIAATEGSGILERQGCRSDRAGRPADRWAGSPGRQPLSANRLGKDENDTILSRLEEVVKDSPNRSVVGRQDTPSAKHFS